ncbi:hypothetical protein EZV62_010969 [Acer yangbiense]|uniref:Photosystem I assembly protein Ycf4 n=1 Tax=Acer yangbiense TaxID=1000413 RepID=A0A5C7I4E1_9ROSI|nr:hypothetical protein EZV62_010969 [Acer yangbiense]
MNICEQCGYYLKISSSDRIELSVDPGTWDPMDDGMVSLDPIEFHSEEEPYKDRIDSYQKKTGLTEAVQTGTGQLNGIPVAIGVMDFQFMGGSMGSVVGEKITRLIKYATNKLLPLILVCASGGARMQEGSLSLMQMAKISSALYDYQSNKKLFYVSILTSPTTGGVTASFGMLGDIIIAEPNAYIAFAGKRVIEQTLNKTVPEGSQAAEYLFHKGLFDPIVPRNPLKGVLSSGYDRFDRKEGISIRIEVKEGIYARHVLYMEIRGLGDVPLTHTDKNLTPREIEQKAAELAYFLRVPIEADSHLLQPTQSSVLGAEVICLALHPSQGNLVSLCMKIINSVVVVGLYYGFLTTFSIGPSYLLLLRARVMEEGTEKKVSATTGFIAGQLMIKPYALEEACTVWEGVLIDQKDESTSTDMPLGTAIHNIEITLGKGGQLARAAGVVAKLIAKEGKSSALKLPFGEVRLISKNYSATVGQVGNVGVNQKSLGRAGSKCWLGKRPVVRGVVMNPVDHPHGGGEGRAPIGYGRTTGIEPAHEGASIAARSRGKL